MYEIPNISGLKGLRMCRICFCKSTAVHPANYDEIIALQTILQKVPIESDDILLCNYCGYTLQKYYKFQGKCAYSEFILSTFDKQQIDEGIPPGPLYMRLAIVTPDDQCAVSDKRRSVSDSDKQCCVSDSDAQFDVKSEQSGDEADDIPLALLNNEDEESIQEASLKSENLGTADSKDSFPIEVDKKRKRDKPLKKGFSSRMVQETDEYVVIKLSKEEVLAELAKKRESEQYLRAPYKCERCAKGFNFEEVLLNHNRRHSTETGAILCDICHQYCPSAVSMRGHMKSHNTRYECKQCGLLSSSRQHLLQHHAAGHAPAAAPYRCRRCDFRTNKRTSMQRHARSHAPPAPLACARCGRAFKSVETLRVHTVRHDAAACPRCDICDRRFVYGSLLARHVRAAHGGRDYYCVECDLRFKSADNLKSHFRKAKAHRDTSTYRVPCKKCDETFVTKNALSTHMAKAHGESAAFSCQICQKEYMCRDSLRSHARRAHAAAGRVAHSCPLCRAVFTEKSSLSRHMQTHAHTRRVTNAPAARARARRQKAETVDEIAPVTSIQDL